MVNDGGRSAGAIASLAPWAILQVHARFRAILDPALLTISSALALIWALHNRGFLLMHRGAAVSQPPSRVALLAAAGAVYALLAGGRCPGEHWRRRGTASRSH